MLLNTQFFDDLAENLLQLLPEPMKLVQADLRSHVNTILNAGFHRLNLITQEKWAVQTKVLLKTRLRLEALEAHVKYLEQQQNQP